jgi:GAF domain-containing protein
MREDSGSDAAETRLNRLLNLILEMAVDVLGFDASTVTARHRDRSLSTIAATDQRLIELDDAQYQSGAGPCLSVLDPHGPIYLEVAEPDPDDAWDHFRRTAADLGIATTLSIHIPTDVNEMAASFNLYSKRKLESGEEQLRVAESFAQQLGAAIQGVDAYRSTARLAHDLAEAMRSRAVIEQAKGMLMAEHRIDADEAFARLTHLSQHSRMKLRDVARRLVDERTGSGPESSPE